MEVYRASSKFLWSLQGWPYDLGGCGMRNPVSISQSTLTLYRQPAGADGPPRAKQCGRLGRAYRDGRLICGWVQVTIGDDERLGLTRPERRLVQVRFREPLDDRLRSELILLLRRRGQGARRAAERIEPIEVVIDDPHGERERILGSIEPPQVHHGRLRDIDFALRRVEPAR
jgi:hypothetical protein